MTKTTHISITPAVGTWVVRAGGAVLGESARALELQRSFEAELPVPEGLTGYLDQ